ncbi:MAG: hypothetical protein GVY20_00285 [Bacteroidetes bacterium]|jgi:hypothetical protein|nr:hypothetical protein [Bacteroidota bacterium]
MQLQTIHSQITGKKQKNCFKYWVLFATCCLLTFTHCDDSFQPLKENNQYNFNISGYLDVSADTQWIRVGTIRESIDEPPDPANIKVTLEDLQNGNTVLMHDSLSADNGFLNYWTTMDINKEQTYRITTEGLDKKKARLP